MVCDGKPLEGSSQGMTGLGLHAQKDCSQRSMQRLQGGEGGSEGSARGGCKEARVRGLTVMFILDHEP